MRYLITFILFLSALTAFSQGAVDRIELGYQTTRRGIVWVRPGLPTHEPAWRISRDTNSIMWHNLTTGIRYDWSYDAGVWYTRDFIPSTLPPLDVFTSGAATIDNTQATWINDDGVLHHYSQAEGAWLPDKISFQSAGPTDIAAGVSNGAAVYTTSLWQDSDTYLVYYWDGDSWELLSGSGTNLTYSGTSSPVTLNSSTGTDVTVTAGTGVSLSATSTNMTITNSAPDQTVSITGAGINVVTGTYPTFTITGTEVDGSVTNEGVLGVGAGGASSSTIISNTSGATGVTINAAGILTISESTSSNGGSITITGTEVDGSTTNELQSYSHSGTTTYTNTLSGGGGSWSITGAGIAAISQTGGAVTVTATEVDGSVTNEAQTLSVSGTTSGILTLSTAGGAGGGTATIAAGTGISVAQSGGTITITNSSPATSSWLIDGNTIGATRRIGSNDNFDVAVETNNTDRMWFDNAGAVSVGTTQSTAAQFVVNGLLSANGILVAGGGTLTGPTFYAATGSGSGSNATVLSGVVNMLNGNVEALIQNTATTGTGGALLTLNTHQSATGDPKVVYTTNGTTTWAEGIDNSISGEPWKLTANSDIGAATPAISATTANKVGVNQAAASVTLQVTGTDAVGLPSGTIAQRSAAAIPQIRHNNTFSGFEFYDPNKNYWYRLTCVSSPTVATSAAAGTGATAGLVSGAGSNDVRGAIELTTGSASLAVGTVVNVTYSNPYSGTATNVILTPANDAAATEVAKWRVISATQNGFSIRAVTALTASTTYQFNYSIGQ